MMEEGDGGRMREATMGREALIDLLGDANQMEGFEVRASVAEEMKDGGAYDGKIGRRQPLRGGV